MSRNFFHYIVRQQRLACPRNAVENLMHLKHDVNETPYFHSQRREQSFNFPALLLTSSSHCDERRPQRKNACDEGRPNRQNACREDLPVVEQVEPHLQFLSSMTSARRGHSQW